MKIIILLCLTGMMALSCKQKATDPQTDGTTSSTDLQNYENEIMKIHDEVMPKMSEINKLSSQLREIKKKAGETAEGQPVTIEGLEETHLALRTAEQGMSDWMKNYSDVKANLTEENLKKFYEKELQKITVVKNNMLNSIEKANAWLAAHPVG